MEQAVRKIALLGMGTVGGGVYEIIERQKEEMPFKNWGGTGGCEGSGAE